MSSFYHAGDLINNLVGGAFCYRNVQTAKQAGASGDAKGAYNVAIDASRLNKVYSDNSTVQPAALQALIIIKV